MSEVGVSDRLIRRFGIGGRGPGFGTFVRIRLWGQCGPKLRPRIPAVVFRDGIENPLIAGRLRPACLTRRDETPAGELLQHRALVVRERRVPFEDVADGSGGLVLSSSYHEKDR